MIEFLFFLAITAQCGWFPMGPSDCYHRSAHSAPPPASVTVEAP